MAYYAPFYRTTYYEPAQQNPMGQFNQLTLFTEAVGCHVLPPYFLIFDIINGFFAEISQKLNLKYQNRSFN